MNIGNFGDEDDCIDMNDVWSAEQISKAASQYAEQIRKGGAE